MRPPYMHRLNSLIQVITKINSSLDLHQVLASIMKIVKKVMYAEASSLMLLNPEKQVLEYHVVLGASAKRIETLSLKVGQGVAGWVAETGQALLVPDVRQDPRFYQGMDQATGFVTQALACVPLKVRDKIIGVIEVINSVQGHTFTQEDMKIFEAFASHAAIAIENAKLHQLQIEQKKIEFELDIAREIQNRFLGTHTVQKVDFEMAAWTEPARVIGGDFYDVVQLDDGRWAVIIGDVSGKGIPSALYMAQAISIFRLAVAWDPTGSKVLDYLNHSLIQKTTRGMFVTLCYFLVDPIHRTIEITDGGHLMTWHACIDKSIKWQALHYAKSTPVGLEKGRAFISTNYSIQKGEIFWAYTDGFCEVFNNRPNIMRKFMQDFLTDHTEEPLDKWSKDLRQQLKPFTMKQKHQDDITFLFLRIP